MALMSKSSTIIPAAILLGHDLGFRHVFFRPKFLRIGGLQLDWPGCHVLQTRFQRSRSSSIKSTIYPYTHTHTHQTGYRLTRSGYKNTCPRTRERGFERLLGLCVDILRGKRHLHHAPSQLGATCRAPNKKYVDHIHKNAWLASHKKSRAPIKRRSELLEFGWRREKRENTKTRRERKERGTETWPRALK